jgi:phosphatidate cytidylyltransferase
MLKHRIIFGLLFGALFLAIIFLDSFCSKGWPLHPWSAPPGTFVALGCILLIPLSLREMQNLLAPENVTISLRITIAASLLCMLWPWVEQVSESVLAMHRDTQTKIAIFPQTGPPAAATESLKLLPDASELDTLRARLFAIESSPWFQLARRIRTVKPHYLVPTIIALSLVAALAMHSRRQKVDGAMANAGGTLLAITYLGVLPGFFLPICMTHSAWMLLVIIAIVKAADVGAYATGHMIGKHKLIPWLSPGKTVEGFVGGLVFSAIVAALILPQFPIGGAAEALRDRAMPFPKAPFSIPQALFVGLVLGAIGQLGDLLESLLKRDAGVKDSGRLPGFGGLLDLLDSPLLAAPAAYWLLKLI